MDPANIWPLLFPRKSDDDGCSGSNKNSAKCEKPVNNDDSLTIGLGVGIPVFVILCVLGVILFRTMRRNKKEAMERDPDFDETGEATALPDFPNTQQTYQMENPFHNRNSLRYPQSMGAHNKSTSSLNKSESNDPYLDAIVLPYHHDTGSKASLDMFARQLSELNTTPRASGIITRTRNSSFTNASNFQMPHSNSVSPQKSNLKEARAPQGRSPTKKVGGTTYANVPSGAEAAVSDAASLELVSDSETSGSDSLTTGTRGDKFALNYENESTASFPNQSKEYAGQGFSSNTTTDHSYTWDEKEHTVPQYTINSPETELKEREPEAKNIEPPSMTEREEETEHSPFNDSQVAETLSNFLLGEGPSDRQEELSTNFFKAGEQKGLAVEEKPARSKSPRISAFNLLQNDSDDEGADEKVLSAEQEEELQRMKSVYKVYFDRENSVKHTGEGENREFKYDQTQALPQINAEEMDRLKINNELHTDTNYDKRLTTTSSIYENPDISSAEQSYMYQQQQYAQGQYNPNYYGQEYGYGGQYQGPPPELPQLQQLPPPSDIRKSTIQTYTDFQPKNKNPVNSPKQPFVPIENEGVWSSPVASSPLLQSIGTFGPQLTASMPTYHEGLGNPGVIPSATQMSRSSVVMLNPVTEITKQRTFRPAGSLPGNNSPYIPSGFNQSENDLIPNNRKSDVRRMMNTNF